MNKKAFYSMDLDERIAIACDCLGVTEDDLDSVPIPVVHPKLMHELQKIKKQPVFENDARYQSRIYDEWKETWLLTRMIKRFKKWVQ